MENDAVRCADCINHFCLMPAYKVRCGYENLEIYQDNNVQLQWVAREVRS